MKIPKERVVQSDIFGGFGYQRKYHTLFTNIWYMYSTVTTDPFSIIGVQICTQEPAVVRLLFIPLMPSMTEIRCIMLSSPASTTKLQSTVIGCALVCRLWQTNPQWTIWISVVNPEWRNIRVSMQKKSLLESKGCDKRQYTILKQIFTYEVKEA